MTIEDITDALCSLGRRKTDPMMALGSLLYYGAILANRYDIHKKIDNLPDCINMYIMMFAPSGQGKSWGVNQTEKLCGLENYSEQMKIMYQHFIDLEPDVESDPEMLRFIPDSPTVSMSGSKEGLYSICKSVKACGFGSVNLQVDEFASEITGSQELMSKLKELYDGKYQAKIIKGTKGDSKESDINDIVANMLAVGSLDGIDSESRKILNTLVKSGMYRRSLVINSSLGAEKNEVADANLDEIIAHFKKLDKKWKNSYKARLEKYPQLGTTKKFMLVTDEAKEYIEKIDSMLLVRHQEDKLNLFKSYDVGSLNLIVNMAYIISFLESKDRVDMEHLKYSWTIFSQTRETTYDVFKEKQPHVEIYELLKMKDNMTQSDLLDFDRADCIPRAKNQFKDTMLLVQELAYRMGEELYIGNGIVTRFSIRSLPPTNLDKLIFSIEQDGMMEKSIVYQPVEFKWSDMESLVTSHRRESIDPETGEIEVLGVQSFTCCHYDSSPKTEPHGHRSKDRFIQGQNIIALDIDGGETIDDIKVLLEPYTYILYTTRSHRKAKRDYRDSFRVVMPTKHTYYLNPEQHKKMYSNIAEFLRVDIDLPCRNVSRIWFTNGDAEVFINEGNLFDVETFMPDTDMNEKILPLLLANRISVDSIGGETEEEKIERRIEGMVSHAIISIQKGTLKNEIYNLWMFIMEITGGDRTRAEKELYYVHSKRGFPQSYIADFLKSHN